ncbi:hypothetical protein FB446DRAFT_324547 [Lentinula raphanica]|nr:hypothetical protein FB446DRAFT_324547 [Lentinula raphanica]
MYIVQPPHLHRLGKQFCDPCYDIARERTRTAFEVQAYDVGYLYTASGIFWTFYISPVSMDLSGASDHAPEFREVPFCFSVFLVFSPMLGRYRYGEPVLVSIPVFKLCGHFVLYTTTNKYELRLDRATNFRPYFLHRPCREDEVDAAKGSPRYHMFVCGWTDRNHEEIVRIFEETIARFGEYNRVTNNCRTFLQSGCIQIVRTMSAWHEDMLMVDPGHLWLLGQMANMMYRSMLRDLCRWIWTVKWGPDWESRVEYNGEFLDLADDETGLSTAHIYD